MSTKEAKRKPKTTLDGAGRDLVLRVRGSGPVFLCISGGPTDAGMFTDLAGRLADRCTVVTYDQVALAERLGVAVTHLPGAHGGWGSDPEEFAERLHEALQVRDGMVLESARGERGAPWPG